jgi:hypothetical protein
MVTALWCLILFSVFPVSSQTKAVGIDVVKALKDDVDGDGLNGADEKEAGTDPLRPDSDGDSWEDGEEALGGRPPLDEERHFAPVSLIPDFFSVGRNAHGSWPFPLLADFARSGGFIGVPKKGAAISRCALVLDPRLDHEAARLRVVLNPDVTGADTFFCAGDNEAELWLGTDDSPFGARFT